MAICRRIAFEIRSTLLKKNWYSKQGCRSSSMAARKNEDEIDANIPNKKLCLDETNGDVEHKSQKIRKRNVAVLLAYNGANYYGMQKNPDFSSIEGELLNALNKANLITDEALKDMHLIHFQRAARTDKGVSAARQVVSLKIAENFDVESINANLPEEIRVFSIKRVTKGFNSKNQCMARTYSYTLPTFALVPEIHTEYPKDFRISEEAIDKVNELLVSFLGTHNFHNFTSRKLSEDPSAKRYIHSFKAEKPFVDGEEFITLKVKGQSFMLHQIRKMIGHLISSLKGLSDPNAETEIWKDEKFPIPIAPGLGLILENLHYDRYNRKYGTDGMHEALTWDEVSEEIEKFKKKYIMSYIIRKEIEEKVMFNWILERQNLKNKLSSEMETKNETSNFETTEKDNLKQQENSV